MKESNQKVKNNNTVPKLAWLWVLSSLLLTVYTSNSISLPPISLFDDSCSLPTISECNIKNKDKVKDKIRSDLPPALKKMMNTREVFPLLKLIPASYKLLVVDKGSESQLKISSPPRIFHYSIINLLCDVSSKQISLKNRGQIEFATIVYTENIQKDVDETIQRLDEFQGCTFSITEQKSIFHFPKNTILSPEGTISWKMTIRPYLEFKVSLGVQIFIFIGWFSLIGAFLALIKQLLTVARKGILYFGPDLDS